MRPHQKVSLEREETGQFSGDIFVKFPRIQTQFHLRKGPVQYNKLLEKNRQARTMSPCFSFFYDSHHGCSATLAVFAPSAPQYTSPRYFCSSSKPPLSPNWITLLFFFYSNIITILGERPLSSPSKRQELKSSCFRLCYHGWYLSRRQKRAHSNLCSSLLSPGFAEEQNCHPFEGNI